jgi:hypothetical protein
VRERWSFTAAVDAPYNVLEMKSKTDIETCVRA